MSSKKLKENEIEVQFMVDLETLSNMPNAVICEMGVLCIGTADNIDCEKHNCFSIEVDVQEQVKKGRDVSLKTVKWWLETDSKRLSELLSPVDKIPINNALAKFNHYILDKIKEYQDDYPDSIITAKMWSQGSDFDFPILKTAYSECGMELPWEFWKVRDLRTYREESKVDSSHLINESTKHHVVNDILFQSSVLKFIKIYS